MIILTSVWEGFSRKNRKEREEIDLTNKPATSSQIENILGDGT